MSFNQKKKFVINAVIIWLVTEISLQIFLFYFSIAFATFLSQTIYLVLGYLRYSRAVFNVKRHKKNKIIYFLLLSFLGWKIKYLGIEILYYLGLGKNLSAILILPFLALISFNIQKHYIFK